MAIKVIKQCSWQWGKNNCSYGGQSGKVTHCTYKGIEFYVRENINGINSFLVSSAERQGDKLGTGKVRAVRQCLELFAPGEHWDSIAEKVRETDPLKRVVNKSRRFNMQFINEVFKRNMSNQ